MALNILSSKDAHKSIDTALDEHLRSSLRKAKLSCEKDGVKFTKLREEVLTIILQTGKPIGAYDIMSELEIHSDRERVAPPTVYRTVEFLLSKGFIHRVHSLNAYLPKQNMHRNTLTALFICKECGHTSEAPTNSLQQSVNLVANELKFRVEQQSMEILGMCSRCTGAKRD